MPRFAPLAAVPLAALLALTACSPSAPASSPSSSPSQNAGTGQSGDPAADADESPEAAAGSYSSEDLAAVLGSVTQADGEPLQVIPAEQLEQSMDQARRFLQEVTITPSECEVFVSDTLEAPPGAGVATGVSSSNGTAVRTIVSVASSSDTGFAEGRLRSSAAALDTCSSFTVEAQGVVIDQDVRIVDAETDAEETFGSLTLQSSSDGARQETMTVVGIRGDLAVTAVRTAQDDLPEGTQDELQDLIDATLTATAKG